jgi:hypothetical protein
MKYNKGFMGIGIIIAIVAVLVIGGGAVYFATKTPAPASQNTGENNYQPIVNNTITPTSSQIRTSGAGGKDGTMNTNPDSSITIISPNGGETYTAGSKMTVKWKTKDVSPTLGVWFHLDTIDGKHLDNGDLVSNWSEVLNSGEKTITIPADIPTGQYKLAVTIAMEIEDVSDNFFTIQGPQVSCTLTQPQAQSLVLSTWGGCTPDTCGSVTVSVQNNGGQCHVTAIYGQLRDDSTSSQKKEATATYQNPNWVLGQPTVTWACQLNRGHSNYSTVPCI